MISGNRRFGSRLARGVIGAILIGGCLTQMSATEVHGIHVNGQGEVLVEPDMARYTLNVTRQGRDAAALKKELDQTVEKVLAMTDGLGIKRRDVTAAYVNIHPNYRNNRGESTVDGVIASRTVTIVVRDLATLPGLIDRSLEFGANSIGGVQLDYADRVGAERQALELALSDAQREAAAVAKHLGVRLGDVLDVHVDGHTARPEARMRSMAHDSAGGSLSAGEINVSRTIRASFAIGGK